MSEPQFTPGPWRWELNEKSKRIDLCGGPPGSGFGRYDLTVMDFARWGMGGATPRFRKGDLVSAIMVPAREFGVISPPRAHHADWFKLIEHPDACLIAVAPEMYTELASLVARMRHNVWSSVDLNAAEVILAKARGENL